MQFIGTKCARNKKRARRTDARVSDAAQGGVACTAGLRRSDSVLKPDSVLKLAWKQIA
jgi:hypothetical protein